MKSCVEAFVCLKWQYVFILSIVFHRSLSDGHEKYMKPGKGGEYCRLVDDSVQCQPLEDIKLFRIDGIKSGTITSVDVGDGKTLDMLTVNTEPLILEIKDFLSDEECEHFINKAKEKGLIDSATNPGVRRKDFQLLDLDHDKRLNYTEMMQTIINTFDIYFMEYDIAKLYKDLDLDRNNDGYIDMEEMQTTTPKQFTTYLQDFIKKHPEKHSRMSKQVWYNPDQVPDDEIFENVQKRVQRVVQLPEILIKKSDFQIVSYGVKGHYNAHRDSNPRNPDYPCCNRGLIKQCVTCRYMTVLFYLNDVKEGGGTAFPTANTNSTYCENFIGSLETNLYEYCDKSSVIVTPEKGKAAIWYNHFLDDSGWFGEQDNCTWHGGCAVKDGEKWIANFWIKASGNKQADLELGDWGAEL